MKKSLEFDMPFKAANVFRIDSLVSDEILAAGFEKGVIRLSGPEGLHFTTMEFDKDLSQDFSSLYPHLMKQLKAKTDPYLLSKLPSCSMDIPVNLSRLVIGDWQQIVFYTTQDFPHISIQIEFIPSDHILGLESLDTTTELQTFDITDIIERTLMNCQSEWITLVVPSTSAILYTLKPEYYQSLIELLFRLVPTERKYRHVHGNEPKRVGYTPLRACLISQVLTLPTTQGRLALEGERLFLTEMDIQPRRRDVYFELWNTGESR